MDCLYAFVISFSLIFLSELGDKTQLLVLSFSSKLKTYLILLGVALGSFLSHGVAILFGSFLGNVTNPIIHMVIHFMTYLSFIFFGVLTLKDCKKEESADNHSAKKGFLNKLSLFNFGYILMIASSIAIGELGDKTFLASIGLGIGYPNFKLFLILGAILGMVASDFLAILFGKLLNSKFSSSSISLLSGILFLIFGIWGLIQFFIQVF